MPHILVRDFSVKQKTVVETAAKACIPKKSTSRYCRDAAVEKAGGKLEDEGGSSAPKRAVKRPAKKASPAKAMRPAKKSVFAIDKRLLEPQFRNKKTGRL